MKPPIAARSKHDSNCVLIPQLEKATSTAAIPNTTNQKDNTTAAQCNRLPVHTFNFTDLRSGKMLHFKCRKILDRAQPTALHFRQGLRTLQSVAHAFLACFLMPLNQFRTDRGGAVPYKSGLSVKAARRTLAVLNTPIALRSNPLREIKGVSLS